MDTHIEKNRFEGMKSLIELGAKGHFPLFPGNWLKTFNFEKNVSISLTEKEKAKKIFRRISKHKSLDKKRTVLYSLKQDDRTIFIKVFFKMVEGKILNNGPELH